MVKPQMGKTIRFS